MTGIRAEWRRLRKEMRGLDRVMRERGSGPIVRWLARFGAWLGLLVLLPFAPLIRRNARRREATWAAVTAELGVQPPSWRVEYLRKLMADLDARFPSPFGDLPSDALWRTINLLLREYWDAGAFEDALRLLDRYPFLCDQPYYADLRTRLVAATR